MTGSEFYAYILQVLKRTDKSTEVYAAIADTVIDIRAGMISDDYSEIETLTDTLAIGDYTLNAPTDLGHIIGDIMIKDTASEDTYPPLKKISKEEFDVMYHSVLSDTVRNRNTGLPQHWAYFGGKFYIGPAVDKTTYEFSINKTIEDTPTYTSVSTSIPFTSKFREVVRAGVLFRIYKILEFFDESTIWEDVYERGKLKIIDNDSQKTDGSVVGMQYNGF